MLREGRREANAAGAGNVVWIEGTAESFAARAASFRLTTVGGAFHWMDRARVLESCWPLMEEGAGLLIAGGGVPNLWSEEEPWQRAVLEVIKLYLGDRRRAGSSGLFVEDAPRHEAFIEASDFTLIDRYEHAWMATFDVDSLVGLLYSTSFANPALLGERQADFERGLRKALLAVNADGLFTEPVAVEFILARKE